MRPPTPPRSARHSSPGGGGEAFCIRIVTDLAEAEALWRRFVPADSPWRLWEVRRAFWEAYRFPLHFLVASGPHPQLPPPMGEGASFDLGLLPLQINTQDGYSEFFGGGFFEDNAVFLAPGADAATVIPALFAAVPRPAELDSIVGDDVVTRALPLEGHKYVLDLAQFTSLDDYFAWAFAAKSRGKFKRLIREFQEGGLQIALNRRADIDRLVDFNVTAFGDNSNFTLPGRREVFQRLLDVPCSQHLLSFEIEGAVHAVSYALEHSGCYLYINAGTDTDRFPGLGHYVIAANIRRAIESGATYLDACLDDCNWKERWRLRPVELRMFR